MDPSLQSLASHRLRSYRPALELLNRGHRIHVLEGASQASLLKHENSRHSRFVIGKLTHANPEKFRAMHTAALELIDAARQEHVPVIVDYTDDIVAIGDHRSGPTLQLLLLADCIVCSSELLASRVCLYLGKSSHIVVISDPLEAEESAEPQFPVQASLFKEPLRLLWFGHELNLNPLLDLLLPLNDLAHHHSLALEVVTRLTSERLLELQFAILGSGLSFSVDFVEWQTQQTVLDALRRSQVVLLPVDLQSTKLAASSNRLVEAIWGGCFVTASPIPSYQPYRDFARIGANIVDGLAWFLQNQKEAATMVSAGQRYLRNTLTISCVGTLWEEMFTDESLPVARSSSRHGPLLNLGCGNHLLEGYLNIDVAPERAGSRPDIATDIRDLSIFPDNYASEILAVHVIEHFSRWEVDAILAEWKRVLQPGGRLVLECPNLLSACEALLRDPTAALGVGREGQRSMWVFYGDPAWKDPLMCHRWGYTPQSLSDLLLVAGFIDARQEPALFKLREPRDMRVTARKPG